MNILSALQPRLVAALSGLVDDPTPYAVYARPGQPGRSDYQIEAKCCFELNKTLKRSPQEIASEVTGRMELSDLFGPPNVADKGPPFVNLNVREEVMADLVRKMASDERLGVEPPANPSTYVIDYSS